MIRSDSEHVNVGRFPLGSRTRAMAAASALARRPRPLIGYALFTLAVFVLALAYSLPHDLIATRVLETATAGTPVAVTFQEVSFAFPNGYDFTGLRIAPLRAPGSAVTIPELTVRTPFLGLLLGRPRSASLSGSAYGGTLSGDVDQRGAHTAVDLELEAIDLARTLAPLVPPPGRVAGRANLSLALAGDGRTTQSTEGNLTLTVRGLELQQVVVRGFALPDLTFPDLVAAAQVAGSRLQVKELRATGDALNLGGTGEILLRDPLPQSILNLRLTIDVSPTAPPPLRLVTAVLPKRTGTEKPIYNLSGTLAAPVLK